MRHTATAVVLDHPRLVLLALLAVALLAGGVGPAAADGAQATGGTVYW